MSTRTNPGQKDERFKTKFSSLNMRQAGWLEAAKRVFPGKDELEKFVDDVYRIEELIHVACQTMKDTQSAALRGMADSSNYMPAYNGGEALASAHGALRTLLVGE